MQDVQKGNNKKAILCISGGKFMEKINYLMKNIPEDLRHRYTQENLNVLLNLLKKGE